MSACRRGARPALTALCLIALLGCGPGQTVTGGSGGGGGPVGAGGQPLPGAGDGGNPDGGDGGLADGGDGGSTDAGCTTPDLFFAVDHCNGATLRHSVQVLNSGCQTALYFDQILACTGTVSGGAHAFVGTCFDNLPCTATSLPGVIRCATGPDAGCLIDVCSSFSDPLCQ